MKRLFTACLLLPLLWTLLPAQFGFLDGDFDADGIKPFDIGVGESFTAVAVQPDGRIVMAGIARDGAETQFLVVRLEPDGSLDLSFNGAGYITIDFDPSTSNVNYANDLVLDPDGKIVVVGKSFFFGDEDFAVARLKADGTPDSTFGLDGLITFDGFTSGWHQICTAVARDGDGKYYLGGTNYAGGSLYNCMVMRISPTGFLDPGFAIAGKDTFSITTSGYDIVNDLILLQDGRILCGGSGGMAFNSDFVLALLQTNGSLDSTFSTDGRLSTNIGTTQDGCQALIQQPDGKVVAAGYAGDFALGTDLALARYTLSGSLDLSFDVDGKVAHSLDATGSEEGIFGLAIQPDGKLLVAGTTNSSGPNTVVGRLEANGSPDATFGTGGFAVTAVSASYDQAQDITLQPDHRIVVCGIAGDDAFAARYISGFVVSVPDAQGNAPLTLYPNPVQDKATLKCQLAQPGQVEIHLTDLAGRVLHTFSTDAQMSSGTHEFELHLPAGLAAGEYLVVMTCTAGNLAVKMIKQ